MIFSSINLFHSSSIFGFIYSPLSFFSISYICFCFSNSTLYSESLLLDPEGDRSQRAILFMREAPVESQGVDLPP